MHHMNSEEINSFHAFEHERYAKEGPKHQSVLRLKDIYKHFVAPKLVEVREDWDNLSEDTYYLNRTDGRHEEWQINKAKHGDSLTPAEQLAHIDLEHCRAACESVDDCFQYRWQDGICGTARAFMLGKPRRRDGNEEHKRWRSGWLVEKINRWIEAQGECDDVKWPST